MPNLSPEQQAVTAMPVVTIQKRTGDDEFIMNACDGIWDCLSNEECVKAIHSKVKNVTKPGDCAKVVEEMLDDILAKDTETGIGTDNMTAILIKLNS